MVLVTAEQQAATILAALNAALAPVRAYDYDEVPDSPPTKYVLIDLTRRYVDKRLASGEVSVQGGRLGTHYAAKSVSDARELQRRVRVTLEDVLLPSGGDYVGPFVFQTESPIVPDDKWFAGSDTWTF